MQITEDWKAESKKLKDAADMVSYAMSRQPHWPYLGYEWVLPFRTAGNWRQTEAQHLSNTS